jgi:hypothetical protein
MRVKWDKNAFISEDPQIIPETRGLQIFGPFFGKFGKNSAASFAGPSGFLAATFGVCGRNFGPLATLLRTDTIE